MAGLLANVMRSPSDQKKRPEEKNLHGAIESPSSSPPKQAAVFIQSCANRRKQLQFAVAEWKI